MPMNIGTEAGEVTVETREHAMHMICATAYSMQLNKDELRNFERLQTLAKHFDISTDDIIISDNPITGEYDQGYIYIYSF